MSGRVRGSRWTVVPYHTRNGPEKVGTKSQEGPCLFLRPLPRESDCREGHDDLEVRVGEEGYLEFERRTIRKKGVSGTLLPETFS